MQSSDDGFQKTELDKYFRFKVLEANILQGYLLLKAVVIKTLESFGEALLCADKRFSVGLLVYRITHEEFFM